MNAFKVALSSLTLCAVASAQLQFNQVATVDLASTASNANPEFIGSNPSAVAWDGGDLIVAGFNGGASAATVSLIRVSNVFGSPTLGATFGSIASTPASRGYSGLAVDGGKVAAAHDNGAATATGIALYDASTGALFWQVGSSGTNARGMAGVDFDPGFGGLDLGVNFLEQGGGRRRLLNTLSGTFLYTSGTGAIINLLPVSTGWRDHAFDPATGDLYTRVNNDVSKHTRTGGNAFTPNVRIIDVVDASAVPGQNLEFMDTAFGNFIVYNDRPTTGSQSFASAVRIVDTSGSAATFNFGPGFSPATATGFYDFSWDAVNDRLAVLDFTNRKVYVFELCANVDADGDGTVDCIDGCPSDPLKIAPGACGCGVSDVDSDGDGTADCIDGCPNDPAKIAPGICGCGVSDVDSDGDGTADCFDGCPNDPAKIAPGICGCGVSDVDSDGDGTVDCLDGCPNDPLKLAAGFCGCGNPETDSDNDGTPDCLDGCPNDPAKVAPGICGCGVSDVDSDGDGTADCNDGCPNDPAKTAPGQCGCGVADTDTDGDGVADCNDNCVAIANPTQSDCDGDNVGDACEIFAGTQLDTNLNGTPDDCELGSVFTYCTAGTTTNGCNALITAIGTPSAAATTGFVLAGTGIEGQKQTLLYYGVNGPSAQVWAPGSSSFKCVKQPVQRVAPQNSGGSVNTCSGVYVIDFANYLATKPSAIGNPAFAGEVFNAQLWFRDPPAPSTSSLSNAVQFTMAP